MSELDAKESRMNSGKTSEQLKAERAAYSREWRQRNPDKVRAANARYNESHPGDNAERCRRWRQNHPDRYAASQAAYWKRKSKDIGVHAENGDAND